jgi:hypothetical protein
MAKKKIWPYCSLHRRCQDGCPFLQIASYRQPLHIENYDQDSQCQ